MWNLVWNVECGVWCVVCVFVYVCVCLCMFCVFMCNACVHLFMFLMFVCIQIFECVLHVGSSVPLAVLLLNVKFGMVFGL